MVYGKVRSGKPTVAPDTILLKSDGWPTYHLACVVDDHLMGITHVIRGTEWVPSTPFHLMLYSAFGWKAPQFGHVGLLTNAQGEKFSKRNADIDLLTFQKLGVLPEALNNFVALLGWSHNGKEDYMTQEQLIENFSTRFTKGDVKVEFAKLWFLQRKHAAERIARAKSPADIERDLIRPFIERMRFHRPYLLENTEGEELNSLIFKLLKADSRNWTNANEYLDRHLNTLRTPTREDLTDIDTPIVREGHLEHRQSIHNLTESIVPNSEIIEIVRKIPDFISTLDSSRPIENQFNELSTKFAEWMAPKVEEKLAQQHKSLLSDDHESVKKSWVALVHKYLKWAVVVNNPGPDALKLMLVLGREESEKRLKLAEEVALSAPHRD